jgi:hypothetical protein
MRQALQAVDCDDDYSDDDMALQAALWESFEEAHVSHEEEVVMGVSIASNPDPKLTLVEHGDECCLCRDGIEAGAVYFQTPCKHIYCSECISNPLLLNQCGHCSQLFYTAEPVKVITVKVEDW